MTRRILLTAFLVLLISGSMQALISCGSDEEKGKKLSSEMTELVRYYHEMKTIGLAGEVDRFLSMRDSLTNAEIGAYYERKGWVMDSARVSNLTFNWPDVAGWPLYQDTIDGLWRRVIFKICDMYDESGREQCVYPIIMFRKNGDEWKVSNASRLAAYRFDENGDPVELTQYMFHKMFRLPPSFIDLYPKEGPSKIQPQPIDPEAVQQQKP